MSWDDVVETPKQMKARQAKVGKTVVPGPIPGTAEVREAQEEADRTGHPVQVKGMGTAGTPRLEEEKPSMYEFMRTTTSQLADIWTAVGELRTHMATIVMQLNRGATYNPEEHAKRAAEVKGKVEVADLKPRRKKVEEDEAEAEAAVEAVKENTKNLAKAAQEVLANNKAKKAVVDVPSIDVCNHAALLYIKKHGRGALETRLAQYHAKRVSEIPEEKRHLFLQDVS